MRIESTSLSAHRRLALGLEIARADWDLPARLLWPGGHDLLHLERVGNGVWSAGPTLCQRMFLANAPEPLYGSRIALSLHYTGHRGHPERVVNETGRFAGVLSLSDHALIATAAWPDEHPGAAFDPRSLGLPEILIGDAPARHVLRTMSLWAPRDDLVFKPLDELIARCRAILAARPGAGS